MKTKSVKAFKVGTKIQWTWMGRPVKGIIKKIYFKPVTKVLRGHTYTRNGSPERPAYFIKSEAGSTVLKAHSELRRPQSQKSS